jgi:hypothetical protein
MGSSEALEHYTSTVSLILVRNLHKLIDAYEEHMGGVTASNTDKSVYAEVPRRIVALESVDVMRSPEITTGPYPNLRSCMALMQLLAMSA